MKTINICKAQSDDYSELTEPAEIIIDKEVPTFKVLGNQDDYFMRQAVVTEKLLYDTLPGGLYDRLLGEMLKRKATHFRVAHSDFKEKVGA
jgi:hypothetical protein